MFSKIFCGSKKIFLILAVLFLNLLLVSPALAAVNNNTSYVPLVSIPGVNTDAGLLTYLSGLYNFLISVVGILAMAVIIYGGMRYLTSAGNPSSVEEAKDAITSAVTGLILALVSWLILSTINPDILVLKSVGVSGAGNYSYADAKNTCVANATGTGTAANPCVCVDGKKVYTASTVGPTVTGTSIAPCLVSVPTATSAITITFSEALNPSTVNTSTIKTYFPGSPPVTVALTSPTVVTITIGAPYLAANSPQEIIVTTGVQSTAGVAMNAATCSAAAGRPPAATTAYDLRFTTDTGFVGMAACVSCPFGGSNPCQSICSNTTLANDNAYHCMVADLRAGKTMLDASSKTIWGKVNETIFFDLDTYSIHENPIIGYEVDYDGSPFMWIISDVGCSTVVNTCRFPIPTSPCSGKPKDLNHAYSTAGTYTVWARIIDDKCNASEDRIDVTIENL